MTRELTPTPGDDDLDFTRDKAGAGMPANESNISEPLEAMSADLAIRYFENTDEGEDIEERVEEMIGNLAEEPSPFKISAALILQKNVRENLQALELSELDDLPRGLLARARGLAAKLAEALRVHIQ